MLTMLIVGVDEVGRGCWAGPIVAGAVVFKKGFRPRASSKWKLADSKTLNKEQRQEADFAIRRIALAVGLGWVDSVAIDKLGITAAIVLAMEQAVRQIECDYDEIIIDGHINFLKSTNARALIGADATEPSVSAASIIAKVARDNYMAEIAEKYPHYGFERHVGYGTRHHQEMLKIHGVSNIHRRSYKPIKALLLQ